MDVTIRAEWPMLWSEFKPVYPDMGPFVPGVAGVVKRWCELFYARLQDDQHSAWADEVLEKLSKARGLKAYLQVRRRPGRGSIQLTREETRRATGLALTPPG